MTRKNVGGLGWVGYLATAPWMCWSSFFTSLCHRWLIMCDTYNREVCAKSEGGRTSVVGRGGENVNVGVMVMTMSMVMLMYL